MLSRLAYLVTPRPELLLALNQEDEDGHEICQPVTVITPARDYEEAFEGWKKAWKSKAKQDFVASFVGLWAENFPAFTSQLQQPECFDHWWTLLEIDVMEIDSAWAPS